MKIEAVEKALLTVYTEHPSELHTEITRSMVEKIASLFKVGRVLDVGCGMGVAWPFFSEAWPGVRIDVLTPDAIEQCEAGISKYQPYWVGLTLGDLPHYMRYDLVWARHSLEHSIEPFADLIRIANSLEKDGVFYMEVPAPGTVCRHECNPNHYSVLGKLMWMSLLDKTGFQIVDAGDIGITLEVGDDVYYWFLCRKKAKDNLEKGQ